MIYFILENFIHFKIYRVGEIEVKLKRILIYLPMISLEKSNLKINKRCIKLPYVVTFTWYPPSLSNTVAQRYLETIQKYPIISSIKRIIPAAIASTKEGIEGFVVDEVKREDVGEALDYGAKFLVEFHDIEGFRYHIRTFSTLNEAMEYIGK